MGLDMYLGTTSYKVCKAANEASNGANYHIRYGTAIYWRKANAIHNWFVENVQYGDDSCNIYEVSVDKLKELRRACKRVISHPDEASSILPTRQGFFFGGTDYDDYYFDELKRTVAGIDAIFHNIEEFESEDELGTWGGWREKDSPLEWPVQFFYQSSW